MASLGESGQLDGFNLTSMMQSARGRGSMVHVEVRELCPGGHIHTQVEDKNALYFPWLQYYDLTERRVLFVPFGLV